MATILALLCTECPRKTVIFQGTTTMSRPVRGIAAGSLYEPRPVEPGRPPAGSRLTGLATKLGLTYTRYADDLTFSGDEALENRVGYLMARVRHIAQDEGFRVNEAKSRVQRRQPRRW